MPIIMTTVTDQIKRMDCINATKDELRSKEISAFNYTPDSSYTFSEKVSFFRIDTYSLNESVLENATVYIVSSANHYYTIFEHEGELHITRYAYHDDRDPYPEKLWKVYEYKEKFRIEDKEYGYDKNLVDEFVLVINPESKKYRMLDQRHTLGGGSGHGVISRITEETVNNWEPKEDENAEDNIRAILMIAQTTISELEKITGLETIIDFKLLSTIPNPDDYKGKRKKPENNQ